MLGVLGVMMLCGGVVLGAVPTFMGWYCTWSVSPRSLQDDVVFGWCQPGLYRMALYSVDVVPTFTRRHGTWSALSQLLRDGTVLGQRCPDLCEMALYSIGVVRPLRNDVDRGCTVQYVNFDADVIVNSDWKQNMPHHWVTPLELVSLLEIVKKFGVQHIWSLYQMNHLDR